MIKSKKGNVTIKGSKLDIQADLACLIEGLIEGEIMNVDEIHECIKLATLGKDKRRELYENIMTSIFSDLFEGDK